MVPSCPSSLTPSLLKSIPLIHFFTEDHNFSLKDRRKVRSWIDQIVQLHNNTLGEVNYIFCSDDFLHKMNVDYLQHDTLTDIITFDYCEGSICSGDLFISIDRVKDNAKELKSSMKDELHRVMIHGILHLLGFKDKTPQEAEEMRSQEEKSLILREF